MDRLRLHTFGAGDPIEGLGQRGQAMYLRCYLADLGCSTVVEEPCYFDRDYLAEFAAFYSTSTQSYGNRCKRLHFFAGNELKREHLRSALAGRKGAVERLQENYLGFAVIRPIPAAPLGRTVLMWYPEQTPATPRKVASRQYTCHLAGVELRVRGLAWQQQDTGVGACATVAIWSMLHSSAFDPQYAIPTTAAITQAAHRTASLGDRVFPSSGLKPHQLLEAIKEFGLTPVVIDGDHPAGNGVRTFSAGRFAAFTAAMIRSGYPVLIAGRINGNGHAACAVGFREVAAPKAAFNKLALQDAGTEHFYIHDDNIGPNVRFAARLTKGGSIALAPSAPPRRYPGPAHPDPAASYGPLVPEMLVCAMHASVRVSPLALHKRAIDAAQALQEWLLLDGKPDQQLGLTLSVRFALVADYLHHGLETAHPRPSDTLAKTRLALVEDVSPMSQRVGIVRIGLGSVPLVDVLFDTSDSERHLRTFCSVCFHPLIAQVLGTGALRFDFGKVVESY